MYEGRNLKTEIEELGIVAMEDIDPGHQESAFAALDAIRDHNKQYSNEKLVKMIEEAIKQQAKDA
jgi:hypothetical protein